MKLQPLVFAAMMAGVATVLQTAPVWWGEPLGYLLAAAASLPIAVTALMSGREACLGYITTILLCLMIHPEEALVFAVANGPFGLALGLALRGGRPLRQAVPVVAAVLTLGMWLLSLVVPALGSEVGAMGRWAVALVYLGFAVVWSWLFAGIVRILQRRLAELWDRGGSTRL